MMKVLKFKCRLCSDIILNVKSATEGSNNTLDFIPGNNFLGIVASQLYNSKSVTPADALDLFHNGVVRYGDAHLAVGDKRTLKVPAVMYYPKLKSPSEELYIYYAYDRSKDNDKHQLKQCRNGFYAFDDNKVGTLAEVKKSFAIKSAYDRTKRRSMDKQMFGYESLREGLEFYFSVEIDKEGYEKKIIDALVGTRHLGRSRTAQYGLVEISECNFKEEASSTKSNDGEIKVYADGRLIFLDESGEPTFTPSTDQLGINGGEIVWEKSQIRIFQYAPWNGKRQAYDTDRCGIEKGSVFVVKNGTIKDISSNAVGSYLNEGFGKVIYNPRFLSVQANTNGKAEFTLQTDNLANNSQGAATAEVGTPLLSFIKMKKEEAETIDEIYNLVNKFVEQYKGIFLSDSFASQWGTIRSIAMAASTKDEIKKQLFDETKPNLKGEQEPSAYLTHGVAKEKWDKNGRKKIFKEKFFDLVMTRNDRYVKFALINLASQMAKLYRKEANDGQNK